MDTSDLDCDEDAHKLATPKSMETSFETSFDFDEDAKKLATPKSMETSIETSFDCDEDANFTPSTSAISSEVKSKLAKYLRDKRANILGTEKKKTQPDIRPVDQITYPLTNAEVIFTKLVRIKMEQSNDGKTVECKTKSRSFHLRRFTKAKNHPH
jgi:hypothetical protein